MAVNTERIELLRDALAEEGLDALICALPANVLMISGYWPVTGTALAIVDREGNVEIVAPSDEKDLAGCGWAREVTTFEPGSLEEIGDLIDSVAGSARDVVRKLGLSKGRIGYERSPVSQPVSYCAVNMYGASILDLLYHVSDGFTPVPADDALARLQGVMTPHEIEYVRRACDTAGRAYETGVASLAPGMPETEAAEAFRAPLASAMSTDGKERADGFIYCMAGERSAQAFRSHGRTTGEKISEGDLVMIHCNSYVNGYWTDITRTYALGELNGRRRKMFEAVLASRQAVLGMLRPGLLGSEVDAAAREVLAEHGFGDEFKHPTGHGVGFASIDHHARPNLHPKSTDRLETGMVFNVEPAVYLEGNGGVRHCDMIALTSHGAELLTPFHAGLEDLLR